MTNVLRLAAVALVVWLFGQAACLLPWSVGERCDTLAPGLSTFGRPPQLIALWLVAGAAAVVLVARAPTRLALGRHLALLTLLTVLLDGELLPATPELSAALAGLTLVAAADRVRLGTAAAVGTLALLLGIPAVLGGQFPHGALVWALRLAPLVVLCWVVPALFAGRAAERLALAVIGATAVLAVCALASYLALARGLELPLATALRTRLFFLGLHPNLAVPHLVAMLVLGTALAWSSTGTARRVLLAACLVVLAALCMVRSRTGFLAAAGGLALLVGLAARWRGARWVQPVAGAAVVLLLLVPASGLTDAVQDRLTADTAVKAVSFRSAMWELGRDTAAAAPWHGWGPGTRYVQGRFAQPSRYDGLSKSDHPHNVVLAVGAELGVPGWIGLALLLGASLRRARGTRLLAPACNAALLGVWACNAIDMGGAATTLYPSLVLLLLALRDGAERDGAERDGAERDDSGREAVEGAPSPRHDAGRASSRRAAVARACGLLLVLASLPLLAGAHALAAAERQLAEATDAARPATALRWAGRLRPLDPRVPQIQAELARRPPGGERWAEAADALSRALGRMPGSAYFTHQLAVALSHVQPGSDRVHALLADAVAADPYGSLAWRSRLDLAASEALRGARDAAFDELVSALVLNPGAAAQIPLEGRGGDALLRPAGPGGVSFRLDEVLAGVRRRRARLGAGDAPTEQRLRLREVEIPLALGQHELAEERTRELFADNPLYLATRLASAALAQKRYADALAELARLGEHGAFHLLVDELTALSHHEPLDEARFAAVLERALAALDDVTFEPDTVARLLEARRHVAERRGDALAAARLAEAIDFARR